MRRLLLLLIALAMCPQLASAQATLPTDFVDDLLVSGLSTPAGMAFAPDGPSAPGTRLVVVEQRNGRIRLLVNGALSTLDPVGTVPNVLSTDFYRGLLGIAFDPRWPSEPYIYVHFHRADSVRISISRYTLTGDLSFTGSGALSLDPASRYDILRDIQGSFHAGGTLRFGLDSLLYASVGDGYSTPCTAQDTTALTGKILRLEVRALPPGGGGPPARELITPTANPFFAHPNANARLVWAMGLRNPYRFQIDAETGALLEGDVGQVTWEEINYMERPGANYGWPLYEGPSPYISCPGVADAGFEKGIYWYGGGQSVVIAGVYRRAASLTGNFPMDYEGDALVHDYYTGRMQRLRRTGDTWAIAPPAPGQPNANDWATGVLRVSDWAQAPDGTLWYVRQSINNAANTGQIRRVRFAGALAAEPAAPAGVTFAAPAPTPAHGRVRLAYTLPERSRSSLRITDASGRLVASLETSAWRAAGLHEAWWPGTDARGRTCRPGLYFAILDVGGHTQVQRVVLTR